MILNKSVILLGVLSLSLMSLQGCETAKGAAYGVATTAKGVGEGVGATAYGAAKDTANLWQGILKADDWMRKNLW